MCRSCALKRMQYTLAYMGADAGIFRKPQISTTAVSGLMVENEQKMVNSEIRRDLVCHMKIKTESCGVLSGKFYPSYIIGFVERP